MSALSGVYPTVFPRTLSRQSPLRLPGELVRFVRTVFEDSRGALWVGTDDDLFQRHGDRFER